MSVKDGKNFSYKFSFSLEVLELSNIAASKLLNIDASYVSRIKRGTRVPKSDSELALFMSNKLGSSIWEKNLTDEFQTLLSLPSSEELSEKEFLKHYSNWFLADTNELEISYAIELMESIQDYSEIFSVIQEPEVSPDLIFNLKTAKNYSTYYGTSGLLKAVLHFFVQIAKKPEGEIQLYSEQSLDWFTANLQQAKVLQSLIAYCLRKGAKITILHYLGRGSSELINGFRIWIPLYFMGDIESYYCNDTGKSPLCHTIINHKNHAAIQGMCVSNLEDEGLYSFIK